ncbi:MAG: CinA family nicotinamide mononucleotide deamidase-related protein [Chloroflexota bacterium]
MASNVSAELVSIGTEILLGEITDTNSVFMARTLRDMGVSVYYMISVGDNRQRIADVIRTSLSRSDIVITCGGLGPTVDDMTRDGVALATDRGLVFHDELLQMIAARFEKYRVKMTDNNKRQAYLPEGALVIENPVGTAPSYIVEVGEKVVISLPGVPREMKFLMTERVIPYLREKYGITEQIILARILKTGGIGESTLDEMLGNNLLEASNPTVGLAAHSGQIDIRITAKADTRAQASEMIDTVEKQVRDRAGSYIFGVDDDTLEAAFADLLKENNATLAITETGIGTTISERLLPTMGTSLMHAAEMHESPETLRESLSIDDSSLQSLADAAAKRLLEQTGATVSIAVVSRPDIDENSDKEAGTAVVVCTAEKSRHRIYGFGGRNENVKQFVGNWSTAIAWRMTKELFNA